MGGSPKALVQHLAGETSLLRTSPTLVARAQCHHEKGVKVMAVTIMMTINPINIGLKSKSFGMPMKPRQYAKSLSRS